ncbi:hypothetical protein V6N11_048990 [Hibiscus sabdariffa]|uniref:Uncharacterized protein n=1 Tax=Hibiscus sabdariffa TaxID=183260 RepID=A0ABR2PWW1_9ROSI
MSTIFYGSNESCGADKTEITELLTRYLAYMGGRTNNAEESTQFLEKIQLRTLSSIVHFSTPSNLGMELEFSLSSIVHFSTQVRTLNDLEFLKRRKSTYSWYTAYIVTIYNFQHFQRWTGRNRWLHF